MSDWFDRYGWGRIDATLVTGACPYDHEDVAELAELGVTTVVNLCEDAEYEPRERAEVSAAYAQAGITELRYPTLDYGNLLPGLLEQASRAVVERLAAGDVVYLHCRAGWQRSATVAAAAIARRDDVQPDAALGVVKTGRSSAQPLHHQLEDLWRWWRARNARAAER